MRTQDGGDSKQQPSTVAALVASGLLPPLPRLPGKTEGAREPASWSPTDATKRAEKAAKGSVVVRQPDDDHDHAWFPCARCGSEARYFGSAWGRWDLEQLRPVLCRPKVGRARLIFVPVSVAGRVCEGCKARKDWRNVAEPNVTGVNNKGE